MNICYYCQDSVGPADDFLIVQPDQTQIHVCSECMSDVIRFFRSGEAEDKKIEALKVPLTPIDCVLGISRGRAMFVEMDNQYRPVKYFRNIKLTDFSYTNGRQQSPFLRGQGGYSNPFYANMPATLDIRAEMVNPDDSFILP